MKRLVLILMVLAMVIPAAFAQETKEKMSITPFGGLMLNGDATLTVGSFLDIPLGNNLYVDIDASIAFQDTWLMANGGVLYAFPLESGLTPYVAGGLGIWHYSASIEEFGFTLDISTTDLKLNLGGGIKWAASKNLNLRADFRFFFIEGTGERIVVGVELML